MCFGLTQKSEPEPWHLYKSKFPPRLRKNANSFELLSVEGLATEMQKRPPVNEVFAQRPDGCWVGLWEVSALWSVEVKGRLVNVQIVVQGVRGGAWGSALSTRPQGCWRLWSTDHAWSSCYGARWSLMLCASPVDVGMLQTSGDHICPVFRCIPNT